MGSESNLKMWVSDKLMSLLGYSQPTVVHYIIGLSKQAMSAADVQTKLEEFGFSSSTETRTFAQEIFARVPRKASGLNGIARVEEKRPVKRRTSKDEDDGSDPEKERLRDQKEKEKLEQHIRGRDAATIWKLIEPKLTRKEEVFNRRGNMKIKCSGKR